MVITLYKNYIKVNIDIENLLVQYESADFFVPEFYMTAVNMSIEDIKLCL